MPKGIGTLILPRQSSSATTSTRHRKRIPATVTAKPIEPTSGRA